MEKNIIMDKEDLREMDYNEIPSLQDILKNHFEIKHQLEILMLNSLGLFEDEYRRLIELEKSETRKALACWFSSDKELWKEIEERYISIL